MMFRHRKICLAYMQCWGLLEGSRAAKDRLWLQAIQRTESYYQKQAGSLPSIVFDLHFRQKLSKPDTLQHGRMSSTTYEKAITDILSTLAICAAELGLLSSFDDKKLRRPNIVETALNTERRSERDGHF